MTNAELAILSLIAEKPRHGYAIEQTIRERGMREWTEIGFSSIYYVLNKLEKEGFIKSSLEKAEGKGPARKIYAVTDAGREVQLAETYRALSLPRREVRPFLLGLSNLPVLDAAQSLEALRSYRQELQLRQEHLLRRATEQSNPPFYVEAMFDYSLMLLQAELKWLDEFIRTVEEERHDKN